MTERSEPFDAGQLPAEARAAHDRILERRGYLPGPYRFWLSSPGFAERIEPLEHFLRTGVSLSDRQVETLVLICARHWQASYVWTAHLQPALDAGVGQPAIDAILALEAPAFEHDADAVCARLSRTLLERREVDAALWSQSMEAVGERGVNELFGLLGLYTSVCLTMVGYRVPTKNGEADPFAGPIPG